MIAVLRSGRRIELTTSWTGVPPGQLLEGQHTGSSCVWVRDPLHPDDWFETDERSVVKTAAWASAADSLDELLRVIGADGDLAPSVAERLRVHAMRGAS